MRSAPPYATLQTFVAPFINICVSSSLLPPTSAYLNQILAMHAKAQLEDFSHSSSVFDRFIEIDPDQYAPHWWNHFRSSVKFGDDWWRNGQVNLGGMLSQQKMALGDIIDMVEEYKDKLAVSVSVSNWPPLCLIASPDRSLCIGDISVSPAIIRSFSTK
jgi:hypothetical protein